MGNIAAGLLAGINAARYMNGNDPVILPDETVAGSLFRYIATADPKHFQPMKANFGILPELTDAPRSKRERAVLYGQRAISAAEEFFEKGV